MRHTIKCDSDGKGASIVKRKNSAKGKNIPTAKLKAKYNVKNNFCIKQIKSTENANLI